MTTYRIEERIPAMEMSFYRDPEPVIAQRKQKVILQLAEQMTQVFGFKPLKRDPLTGDYVLRFEVSLVEESELAMLRKEYVRAGVKAGLKAAEDAQPYGMGETMEFYE